MKSYPFLRLTRDLAVVRATTAANLHTNFGYKLGAGGRNPRSDFPYSIETAKVDCSGFVAWVLGYDRYQDTQGFLGDWVNTDWILNDALEPDGHEMFELVADTEKVLPGDLLVRSGKNVNGEWKHGHVGIITRVRDGFQRQQRYWYKHLLVAHASPSHRRKYGNVVAETDATAWAKVGYIVRYLCFSDEP